MRKKFLSSYPGELLTPELMPASGIFVCTPACSLYRCQSVVAVEIPLRRGRCQTVMLAARALTASFSVAFLKLRKSRRALLHMSPRWPGGAHCPQSPLCPSNCLALLEKVHLLVIKRFNDKFLSFALASFCGDGSGEHGQQEEHRQPNQAEEEQWGSSNACLLELRKTEPVGPGAG